MSFRFLEARGRVCVVAIAASIIVAIMWLGFQVPTLSVSAVGVPNSRVDMMPVGEFSDGVMLEQEMSVPSRAAIQGLRSRDVCIDVLLANFSNRKNSGIANVDIVVEGQPVTSQRIDFDTVLDNQMHLLCVAGLGWDRLVEAESVVLRVHGVGGRPGSSITAWATTDLSAGKIIRSSRGLEGRSLVFRFVDVSPSTQNVMSAIVLCSIALLSVLVFTFCGVRADCANTRSVE